MKTVPLVASLLVLALLGGATWITAVAEEPDSAFTPDGGAAALVTDARALNLETLRLVSGPGPAAADPDLDPSQTLLVVIAPTEAYSQDEAEAVQSFLQRGGQVLVADAFGSANTLTAPLGLVFERVRLVETDLLDADVPPRTYQIGLRTPTALHVDADAPQVLARSGTQSFIDRDGNGVINAGDPPGPFDVAVLLEIGTRGGRIVAIADPGLFLADADEPADNRAWRRAVLNELLPDGGTLLVDESHGATNDPVLAALGTLWATTTGQTLRIALPILAGLLALATLLPTQSLDWSTHRFRPHAFIRRKSLLEEAGSDDENKAQTSRSGWTRRGTLVLVAALALAIAGLPLASHQATVAAAILAAAALAATMTRPPSVVARRTVSTEQVAEDTPLTVELSLRAHGRRSMRVEIRDELPPEFQLNEQTNWFETIVTPTSQNASYVAAPALRGPYPLGPLRVRRSDALQLRVRDDILAPATRIEVTPRRESVNRSPFKTRIPSITLGPHMVNRAGDGSEFHALREYQRGDSFRSINWKASARSKGLVVNQRVHESMTTITILLDARAISGAGPSSQTPLAQGCRAAFSLAAGALQQRDRVHLVVYGDGIHEIPPAPGSRQLHQLQEHLAMLPARGNTTLEEAITPLLPRLKNGNPIVLVSGLEGDPTLVPALANAQARGLIPVVIAAQVGTQPIEEDADDKDPEPGADAIQAAREETISKLRATGVSVFDTIPDIPLDTMFRLGAVA